MILSLIIPIYNVEKYLEKCINSCVNQNISSEEYEIILVNDGSPDNSLSIAKSFAEIYHNILILDQQNGGVSNARNNGLRNAHGKYIWFIDSDDWIQENILYSLIDELESNQLDILWLQWKRINDIGTILPDLKTDRKVYDFVTYDSTDFLSKVLGGSLFSWAFIYKKDFLLNNEIYFNEHLSLCEDADFILRALPKVGKIKMSEHISYFYLQRSSSATNNITEKKINDILFLISSVKDRSEEEEETSYFYNSFMSYMLVTALRLVAEQPHPGIKKNFLTFFKKNRFYVLPQGGFVRELLASFINISPALSLSIATFLLKIRSCYGASKGLIRKK